ncbi:hypothetical protein PR202_ga15118 [Eleusine coracana subsp. coracana]|uniref:Strictosidine synthase conserved region domain-containing protein n=1 Tax=Eleusine coracana subsp. coracana TaxID=191504 RepID=A0AAV5CI91_ELECO|nr:hypothetical protein QOZ80_6BG0496510 [Eleusine coracana subsp. coracana]GJM98138.1 hypothetical protein PR202_ga15118 [Eleusine coracana subsp. coracana]
MAPILIAVARRVHLMAPILITGLAVLMLASSCAGTKHEVVIKNTWSIVVDDLHTGNKSYNDFQPSEFRLPDGATGAESLAFDRRGEGPYTGVSDGRIFKWVRNKSGANGVWITFAYNANYINLPICKKVSGDETVCGRPLGVQFFHKTGELYIADAYLGLMKVGPRGGMAKVLATEADGVPFTFVNGLDIDQSTGDVYFTDSSTKYQRRNNTQVMFNRDTTGRLLKYDARTRRVTVLKSGLPYPNGVAVSSDQRSVVVAHTWPSQAFTYWFKGPKAGQYELFADLPGYPDNVRRDNNGGYWFALNQEKVGFNPKTHEVTPPPPGTPHLVGIQINSNGTELAVLTAPKGVTLSDVAVRNGMQMWLGSVELDYVGLFDHTMIQ